MANAIYFFSKIYYYGGNKKMGVLTMELERMNKTIIDNQKEVEKLTKQLEKEKEKKRQLKEYEKDKMKAVDEDLRNTFKRSFEKEGFENAYINLRLRETRDEILKNVPETDEELHYIDRNYEKILNEVKKIYENNKKANEEILKIQFNKQEEINRQQYMQEQKKINIFNIIGKILKWTCIVLFGGIYLIFKFINDLSKNMK